MQPVSIEPRRGERVIAFVLFVFGVYVAWQSFGMPAGTFATPGPAFFPRAIGILLAVSSVLVFLRRDKRDVAPEPVALGHREVFAVVATLLVAAGLFVKLGAIATLGLMSCVLVKILHKGPWWKAALFGACTAALAWLSFVWLLGVRLPPFTLF
jgi:hypothetical protein